MMKIAVYQGEGADLALSPEVRTDMNLETMSRAAFKAAGTGASLIVFPELFLTNYNIGDDSYTASEPADGPSAQRMAMVAREADIAICYGFPERDYGEGKEIYNSMSVINRQGELVATYRKAHLFGKEEHRLFTAGDELAVVELDGWKFGLAICYDVEFPELIRSLALAGAEAVIVPTALMEPYDFVARQLVPTRAIENQLYLAYANRCGREGKLSYCGLSCIVDPEGKTLARAEKHEDMLTADLHKKNVSEARKLNPYLRDRRPELYTSPIRRA